MPSRIIHEKCRKSRTLNALSPWAERLFWRLTTVADDYGRFDADPRVMLSDCFPLKVLEISPEQVQTWRDELTQIAPGDDVPLIRLYTHRSRIYGYFVTWTDHQRDRSQEKNPPKPKFPPPVEGVVIDATTTATTTTVPALEAPPPTAAELAEARFEQFWKDYPARNGKKVLKGFAKALFLKLSPEDQADCARASKEYAKHCAQADRCPKDAARFIQGATGELWRDFIPVPQPPPRRPLSAVVQPTAKPANPPPEPEGVECPPELRETMKRLLGKTTSCNR